MISTLTIAASLSLHAAAMISMPIPSCTRSRIGFVDICVGHTLESFEAAARQALARHDADANGLDAADIELLRQRQRARERAASLESIMVFDLDDDFEIDEAEMERAVPAATSSREREGRPDRFLRFDANHNGRIERDEILGAPLPQGNLELLEALRAALAKDPNRDARLEPIELAQRAAPVFREVDGDGDGIISRPEYEAEETRSRSRRESGPMDGYAHPVCAMPPVPDDALLLAYNSYGGDAPVAAGGAGPATDIRIEPGSRPLYLILASFEPVSWRFSGHVERIARVVLSARTRGADQTGLPSAEGIAPDRVVTFRTDCFGGWRGGRRRGLSGLEILVWRSAGRRPDLVAGNYSAVSVALPSGGITTNHRDTPTVPTDICANPTLPNIPTDYGPAGLRAAYSFVVQGAADPDLATFLARVRDGGYGLFPITANLAGYDTLFVTGPAVLVAAADAEREFRAACALAGGGRIFLSHVRHNRADDGSGSTRVH